MGMFVRDAGWGIWPVLLFGVVGVIVALRSAQSPSRERLPVIVGLVAATVLLGVLGTVVGIQTSASAYFAGVSDPQAIFVEGVRESLNNMVAAMLLATLQVFGGTLGAYRSARATVPSVRTTP